MQLTSKQPLCLACAIASAAALAGCGGTVSTGSYSGESHAVAERISAFQRDATEASQKKVCNEDLSAKLREQIAKSGKGCEEALKEQLKAVEDITLEVKSISVQGKSASAQVSSTYSGKPCASTLLLAKEGSAWRISGQRSSCR
ncbi:MAG TPA: hypothetical protein VKU89_01500 [Solirubrobacteraceae bacterium]|nr:hypothetical protein [Solirubrobacteraceae bacterium]